MEILRYRSEILGFFGVLTLFVVLLPVRAKFTMDMRSRLGRKRLETRIGFLEKNPPNHKLLACFRVLNHGLSRLYRKNPGKIMYSWWQEAGFGSKPVLFTFSWLGIILSGFLIYHLTPLNLRLSLFLTVVFVLSFIVVIYFRARFTRQLFQAQLPDTLDRLAGSLQAGFSLPQAIGFIAANLPEPSAAEISRVYQQINIGYPVEEALEMLYQRQPIEEVRLWVAGLTLQKQVGGNMAEMMFEMADIVRKRVELKSQVQTLTAQGRVSALVLALLIPVSLGLLSLFPGYIEVLFDTRAGNLVLITAGSLELLGAGIIFQLIKVEE